LAPSLDDDQMRSDGLLDVGIENDAGWNKVR
jgi:hypothetical protein